MIRGPVSGPNRPTTRLTYQTDIGKTIFSYSTSPFRSKQPVPGVPARVVPVDVLNIGSHFTFKSRGTSFSSFTHDNIYDAMSSKGERETEREKEK